MVVVEEEEVGAIEIVNIVMIEEEEGVDVVVAVEGENMTHVPEAEGAGVEALGAGEVVLEIIKDKTTRQIMMEGR